MGRKGAFRRPADCSREKLLSAKGPRRQRGSSPAGAGPGAACGRAGGRGGPPRTGPARRGPAWSALRRCARPAPPPARRPPPQSARAPPGPASAGGRAAAARVAAAGRRCCRPQPAPCSACRTRSSSKLASSPCSSPGAAAAVSAAPRREPRPRAGSAPARCRVEPSRDDSFGGPVPGRPAGEWDGARRAGLYVTGIWEFWRVRR